MKKIFFLLGLACLTFQLLGQQTMPSSLLYGVAYYDEYMPYERLQKDIAMMKAAGINVVRIAESTWSTVEPQEGVFDFSHIDRVLNAMHQAGIKVIIGTPTYAVPTWLVRKHPDVLAITPRGQNQYGVRQNMDITNVHFLEAAERVIRKMLEHVKDHPAIIGYQVDNETKAYQTAGPEVQKQFVTYCKNKFKNVETLNKAFGLDYWSNRINTWDDFPSMVGTINASLSSEFAKFQRQLVTDYLAWQAKIVREYKRPTQFVTQNFDLDWRGYSYGIQTEVNHFDAAKALDIAGIDIYHPTQDNLTGIEIALGGDLARSMKGGQNYFVLETQAQGFPQWVPYPNQLRLQAFSHLASGANMVEYWHWHSIHNSVETYWKGLLSHDFEPNPTYNEAMTIGRDFQKLSPQLVNLKKDNKVAILFSNEAQTAFNAFSFGWGARETYNDIFRAYYDVLYKMNVEVDLIDPSTQNWQNYKVIVVPALYAAPAALLEKLNAFVKNGGHVVYTFKSAFSDENVQVRTQVQPALVSEACGVQYSQFTFPERVSLSSEVLTLTDEDKPIKTWMELLTPTTAKVLASYQHPVWGKYAAITQNQFGKGLATYIGCWTSPSMTRKILTDVIQKAGLWKTEQQMSFPLIVRSGQNGLGKQLHYIFNYAAKEQTLAFPYKQGKDLLTGKVFTQNLPVTIAPWDLVIVEEGN